MVLVQSLLWREEGGTFAQNPNPSVNANSHMHMHASRSFLLDMERYFAWHRAMDSACKDMGLPIITVVYEQMLLDPSPNLQKLLKFMGVSPPEEQVRFVHNHNHNQNHCLNPYMNLCLQWLFQCCYGMCAFPSLPFPSLHLA